MGFRQQFTVKLRVCHGAKTHRFAAWVHHADDDDHVLIFPLGVQILYIANRTQHFGIHALQMLHTCS